MIRRIIFILMVGVYQNIKLEIKIFHNLFFFLSFADICSNKTLSSQISSSVNKSYKPANFNANPLIFQGFNYNLGFMLNITFESVLNEGWIKFLNDIKKNMIILNLYRAN